jgi:hypothetical protein
MGRPPKWHSSRRYHLTLDSGDADTLDAYAKEQGKPPATIGARLLIQALHSATSGTGEQTTHRRRIAELEAANATLRQRLQSRESRADGSGAPRWEWAMEDLLADRGWWATWLPHLHELLGRQLGRHGPAREDVVDDRGYADLLRFLFPPVCRNGQVVAEWNSPDYPHHAQQDRGMERRHQLLRVGTLDSARSVIWEPVIRHVAVALSALELTATPNADPILRMRTEAELTGSWLKTLRLITGDDTAELPGAPM